MNKSKLLALVLSFNFGIFGGNVYAGNGHPLSEHTDLVGKYIVEEKKLAKSLNLFENACGIKYRQKADFFGYDELRDITLHNIYSALSEHNSIVPCYREAQSDMWDIISNYCEAILNGGYKVCGEDPKQILDNFLADLSQELSLKPSIHGLGNALYGSDIYKNKDCLDIACGVISAAFKYPLQFEVSIVGTVLDIVDIVTLVISISLSLASFGGTVALQRGTLEGVKQWSKNAVPKLTAKTMEKLASGEIKKNAIRLAGYKIVNGIHTVAPKLVETVGSKMAKEAVARMAISSVIFACEGACIGTKKTIVNNVAKGSKNSFNSEGTFDLSVQLRKQRINNIAEALSQLSYQIVNQKDDILNSNMLVCALDRRNLNTWVPGLCLVNRWNKPQTSFLKFVNVPGIMSPMVKDCKSKWALQCLEAAHKYLYMKDASKQKLEKFTESCKSGDVMNVFDIIKKFYIINKIDDINKIDEEK